MSEDYKGTSDTFGYIGEIEVKDDGDPDTCIFFVTPDGNKERRLSNIRDVVGEEEFMELTSSDSGGESISPGYFEQAEPVAFKCQGCNQTFPRTMNEGNNYCPDCS